MFFDFDFNFIFLTWCFLLPLNTFHQSENFLWTKIFKKGLQYLQPIFSEDRFVRACIKLQFKSAMQTSLNYPMVRYWKWFEIIWNKIAIFNFRFIIRRRLVFIRLCWSFHSVLNIFNFAGVFSYMPPMCVCFFFRFLFLFYFQTNFYILIRVRYSSSLSAMNYRIEISLRPHISSKRLSYDRIMWYKWFHFFLTSFQCAYSWSCVLSSTKNTGFL